MSSRTNIWQDIRERAGKLSSQSPLISNPTWKKWLVEADQALANYGIPTRKSEAWKYSEFQQFLPHDFYKGGASADVGGPSYLMTLEKALFASGSEALMDLIRRAGEIESDGSVSLHSLLAQDGMVLRVPKGEKLSAPVWWKQQIAAEREGQGTASLNVVWLDEGSEATFIEEIQSAQEARCWNSLQTVIFLGENARLEFARIQNLGAQSSQWGRVYVCQKRASQFVGSIVQIGARSSRETIVADQQGEGASTILNGLAVGSDQQHLDLRTVVLHGHPQGLSEQLHRAIVSGKSRAIFNGRIAIAEGAQKVNSRQLTQSLILTPEAEVDTRPELDVRADDVKANHGASVGQLDAEQMFYLQSRGISRLKAQKMLSEGFALSAVSRLKEAGVVQRVRELLEEKGM